MNNEMLDKRREKDAWRQELHEREMAEVRRQHAERMQRHAATLARRASGVSYAYDDSELVNR